VPYTASRGPGRPPAATAAGTRKRIVHAARAVFSECGYEAATFQAIAIRADLTRPAINHYFSSKLALYNEILERTNDLVVATAVERAQREATLIGRLMAFIAAATQGDLDNPSSAAFLLTSVLESRRHPELLGLENTSLRLTRDFLTDAIDEAIREGELTTTTDLASLTEMLVAVLFGIGFYADFIGSRRQLGVITNQLQQLIMGTLWRFRRSDAADHTSQ
jgi:TetR/AcrR family transcriptional regulator, repressor for uid operon